MYINRFKINYIYKHQYISNYTYLCIINRVFKYKLSSDVFFFFIKKIYIHIFIYDSQLPLLGNLFVCRLIAHFSLGFYSPFRLVVYFEPLCQIQFDFFISTHQKHTSNPIRPRHTPRFQGQYRLSTLPLPTPSSPIKP